VSLPAVPARSSLLVSAGLSLSICHTAPATTAALPTRASTNSSRTAMAPPPTFLPLMMAWCRPTSCCRSRTCAVWTPASTGTSREPYCATANRLSATYACSRLHWPRARRSCRPLCGRRYRRRCPLQPRRTTTWHLRLPTLTRRLQALVVARHQQRALVHHRLRLPPHLLYLVQRHLLRLRQSLL
jgi:hypothetical protein